MIMRLTDFSVQKLAQSKYSGEIHFGDAEEAGDILSKRYPFAGILLLLSVKTADKFAFFRRIFPTANVMVLLPRDGAENLFALPDEISLVLCYGEDYAVQTARYFSAVRALPCALFAYGAPSPALCGKCAEVFVGGEKTAYPVKNAEYLFVDFTLLDRSGLLTAYVDTALRRAALFELRFDGVILQAVYDRDLYETESAAVAECTEAPFAAAERRKIFCAALLVELCRAQGFPRGEAETLSAVYRRLGAGALAGFYALDKLAKVYNVFFTCGKYRKYYTPPYHARIRQAVGLYKRREEEISSTQIVPSVEKLALYAQVFESVRAQFLSESQELLRRAAWIEDNVKEYKGEFAVENRVLNAALKYLPEGNASYGLTSLMRDFGLFDF